MKRKQLVARELLDTGRRIIAKIRPEALGSGAFGALTLLLATLSFAGPVDAAKAYHCEMKANSSSGGISRNLYLYIDEKNNRYAALDSFINNAYKKPIPVSFKRRNANSIQLKWEVKGIPLSNRRQKITANFSVVLTENTGRSAMTVYLRGMDMNPPTGTGKCVLETKPTIVFN